jgi:hypothetical protein
MDYIYHNQLHLDNNYFLEEFNYRYIRHILLNNDMIYNF